MAMNCTPCGKLFSGIVSYNQHIDSEKHKRKISLNLLQSRNDEQQNAINQPADSASGIPCSLNLLQSRNAEQQNAIYQPADGASGIPCYACNISFVSFDCFQRHSMTLEHATNVSKKLRNESANSSVATVSSTTSNELTTRDNIVKNIVPPSNDETDSILPSIPSYKTSPFTSFSECKTCNKRFSGPEPYTQHLVSVGHKKKVEMENYISGAGAGIDQNALNRFACEPCKKVFSGQIPLEQHLISEVHKKKLQNLQLLEQFKVNKGLESGFVDSSDLNVAKASADEFKDMDMNNLWFCQVCQIQCSGPVPYKQHVIGDAHYKHMRKAELSKSFIAPEYKSGDVLFGVPTAVANANKTAVPKPVFLPGANKSSQDMDIEILLPQAMQNLSVMSADEINLKEFLPDQKIDFDDNENEMPKDASGDGSMAQGTFKETLINDEEKLEVYKECTLCSVQLISKEDALSHYESIEHFEKKWHSI